MCRGTAQGAPDPHLAERSNRNHSWSRGTHGIATEQRDVERALIDRQQFHNALEAIWVVIRAANGYVDRQAPWKLKKEDPARMATVLYVLGETIRHLSILCQPVMPQAMEKMLDQLSVPADARSFANLGEGGAIAPGTALPKPEGVFPRFVDEDA